MFKFCAEYTILSNIIMTPLLKLIREMWTDVGHKFVIGGLIKVTKREKTN